MRFFSFLAVTLVCVACLESFSVAQDDFDVVKTKTVQGNAVAPSRDPEDAFRPAVPVVRDDESIFVERHYAVTKYAKPVFKPRTKYVATVVNGKKVYQQVSNAPRRLRRPRPQVTADMRRALFGGTVPATPAVNPQLTE